MMNLQIGALSGLRPIGLRPKMTLAKEDGKKSGKATSLGKAMTSGNLTPPATPGQDPHHLITRSPTVFESFKGPTRLGRSTLALGLTR